MEIQKFLNCLSKLHTSQTVVLKFKESGLTGLHRLHELIKSSDEIEIYDGGKILIYAVLASGRWEGTANQKYRLSNLQDADKSMLMAIARDVDSIEVYDKHGAKGLSSRRQKVKNEAANILIGQILSKDVTDDVTNWGIQCNGSLVHNDGLPALKFDLLLDDDVVTSILLDGWSGQIMVNGRIEDEVFNQPKQIQRIIRDSLESIAESMTA